MTGGGGLRFPFSCTPLPGTLRATDSQVTVITLLFYLGKNKNKPLHDVDYTMQSKAELCSHKIQIVAMCPVASCWCSLDHL